MNSTPVRPASTIRLTAFVPPPPTPTTLITARKFPDWSLTLKVARPEAAVERAFTRFVSGRRLRGFYGPVNGEQRRRESTSTCDFKVATRDWTRGNGDVDVAARAPGERDQSARYRQLQGQSRRIAEPKLGPAR